MGSRVVSADKLKWLVQCAWAQKYPYVSHCVYASGMKLVTSFCCRTHVFSHWQVAALRGQMSTVLDTLASTLQDGARFNHIAK